MLKRLMCAVAVATGVFIGGAHMAGAAQEQWSNPVPMFTQRVNISDAVLSDGTVLSVGGVTAQGATADAELYRPDLGAWLPMPSMHEARWLPEAAPLPGNRVLVVGEGDAQFAGHGSYEIFDGATHAWSAAKPIVTSGEFGGQLTALLDGRVLYANTATDTALYDAASDTWQPIDAPWSGTGRVGSTTRLRDGRVLVTTTNGYESKTSYIFDVATGTWTAAAPLPGVADFTQTALLGDGRVLALNDRFNFATSHYDVTAATFDPTTNVWSSAPTPSPALNFTHLVSAGDGTALAAGGERFTPSPGCTSDCGGAVVALPDTWRFDPRADRWTREPNMHRARSYPRVVVTSAGVLAYGDNLASSIAVPTSELLSTARQWPLQKTIVIQIPLP